MSIDFFRKIIREVVSTDFSNDGQGGIESQTGSDLMGYWHGEGGAIQDSLIDYVLEYQKAAKDMKSSNFILKKIHKMSEGANGGKVSFKIKSGKYESKPIELLVDLYPRTQFSNPIDIHNFSKEDKRKGIEISIFLNGDFVEKVEDAMSFVRNLYHY